LATLARSRMTEAFLWLARDLELQDALAAFDGDLPEPSAAGKGVLGGGDGRDLVIADRNNDVARLEPKRLGCGPIAHGGHDHALCLVQPKLVSDGRQDV